MKPASNLAAGLIMGLAAALLSSRAAAQIAANQPAGNPGFEFQRIGAAPAGHPTITNVQIADFDHDDLPDVIACDAQKNSVYCYRRTQDGKWEEHVLADGLIAPAHATIVDLDKDGDQDVLVSVMGNLFPDDDVIGSLVLLQNDGNWKFEKKVILDDVRRVVDAQPGDFDGDGDLDLAVAVFGYLRGQVLWLENMGNNTFRDHELLAAAGSIHVPVADYDGDGDLDIATVISQDEEEVWGFENLGGGKFTPRKLRMTWNYDLGSAGLVKTDLDGDGDADLLLPVGDNLEDSYSVPQPYHGCFWLENKGGWKFESHRIATFPGTYAATAGDLNGDGRQDIVLCSMVNDWSSPDAASLVWLENDGKQGFTQHTIATDPIMIVTIACSDLNGDGRADVIGGGLHVFGPDERFGRISSWISSTSAGPVTRPATAATRSAEAQSPPLPDMRWIDELTRSDLEKERGKLAEKLAAHQDAAKDWITLGQAYHAYGFFTEATSCFSEAAKRDPVSTEVNYWFGVGLQRIGRISEAIEAFQRGLPAATENEKSLIWHEIGLCDLRLEKPELAEKAFASAGNYSPSLAQLASLMIRSGRAGEATATLNTLDRYEPRAIELFLLKARAADAVGDSAAARQWRDRAEYNSQKIPPNQLMVMIEQIRHHYGISRIADQVRDLNQQKKWNESAALLEKCLAARRDSSGIILLAQVETQRGDLKKAIELLEQGAAERRAGPQSMFMLGNLYFSTGRVDEAVKLWEATAQVRSGYVLHGRLAEYYDGQGDKAAANRHRALKLEAEGIAKLREASVSLAQKDLQAAVDLDPSLTRAWFYLGECNRIFGDQRAARAAYEKLLSINPNHGRALAAMESMK